MNNNTGIIQMGFNQSLQSRDFIKKAIFFAREFFGF
jgi:hypothetical protein